uniref:Protein kinase domain-containing protein n=1 Tax=Odontella aurita TaxID=265563 RepID=A0A7S4IR18_9STRA
MPGGDRDLAEICTHEELGILQIREYMLQVAVALKRLHEHAVIHGDLKMDNIVRFGSKVALIDLDSACRLPGPNGGIAGSSIDGSGGVTMERMGAGSHKFSTGILPPEMIARVDLSTNPGILGRYEEYWRHVSEDAKDLLLLTPDDVQTITGVVKSLLAKSDAVRKMGTKSTLRYSMGEQLPGLEDPNKDWKDILSMALITISFEDLPASLTRCRTVDEFSVVWGRLQANSRLWEKVRPRISSDGKFAYVVRTFDDVKEEKRRRRERRREEEEGSGSSGNSDSEVVAAESDRAYAPSSSDDDDDDENLLPLPYKLVVPSEKTDVWSFGALLFSLCSGGSLFHVGFHGDLRTPAAFADLHGWTAQSAERLIQNDVADPLAQDLLLKVLVPEENRLPNMDAVLRHPFFGPSSGLEAQRILERHEEQQLILEETITITKLTTDSQRRLEFGTEKQCKIVFDEDKVVVPTCLMVLPYQMIHLDDDEGGGGGGGESCGNVGGLSVPTDRQNLSRAVEIGKHLLDINTSTARLSFWLMMKKNLADRDGSEFKSKMKMWLKRARTEASDMVAKEIVNAIGCGREYIGLCMEMLEKGDAVSNARAYIKDPMSAARRAIKASTEALLRCYSSQYVYLLDEYRGCPVISDNAAGMYGDDGGSVARSVKTVNGIYPLRIDPSANLLQHLLLPFMNITVMTAVSVDRMRGLARALGLPPSYGIPERWRESEPGLVHRKDKPSSIAEFAVLHDVIRKRERRAAMRRAQMGESQQSGGGSQGTGLGSGAGTENDDGSSFATGSKFSSISVDTAGGANDGISEMRQLEMFFRDYDSMRIFSDLRRVSDGSDKGLAMWTTDEVVDRMQGEVELAGIETRLREIKREMAERERLAEEMAGLKRRARSIREPPPPQHVRAAAGGMAGGRSGQPAPPNGAPPSPRHHPDPRQMAERQRRGPEEGAGGGGGSSSHSRVSIREPSAASSAAHHAYGMDYMNPNATLSGAPQGAPHSGGRPGLRSVPSQRSETKRKKMRKSNKGKPKLRIRPYFGVC